MVTLKLSDTTKTFVGTIIALFFWQDYNCIINIVWCENIDLNNFFYSQQRFLMQIKWYYNYFRAY